MIERPSRDDREPDGHSAPPGEVPGALPSLSTFHLRALRARPTAEAGRPATQGRAADDPWRYEWDRHWRRLRMGERLASYTETLEGAQTPGEVYTALTEHAAEMVGAYLCLLFLPGPEAAPLQPLDDARLPVDSEQLVIQPSATLRRAGLVTAREAEEGVRGEFAGLAPLFGQVGAATLAYAPFGEGGILLLVERRRGREFEDEHWTLLRTLCAEAGAALERLRLRQLMGHLSLVDPVIGLAGIRPFREAIEHAWVAALQGEPLTVAVMHLHELGRVRQEYGRGVADQILRTTVTALRRETRGAGLPLRYGAEEILLLLPHMDAAQAQALMERVTARLDRGVRVRTGIAQYAPGIGSIEELIRSADRACVGLAPPRRAPRWT